MFCWFSSLWCPFDLVKLVISGISGYYPENAWEWGSRGIFSTLCVKFCLFFLMCKNINILMQISLRFVPKGPINIGSNNGWAQIRQQAIIWTDYGLVNVSVWASCMSLDFWWHSDCLWQHLPHSLLTLNVRGPSYLGLTRSVSWLLMPWLLTSPGQEQPWYWLCWICTSWSYLRKDFKYMCHINVE